FLPAVPGLVALPLDFLEVAWYVEYRGADTLGRDREQLRAHGDDRYQPVGQNGGARRLSLLRARVARRVVLLAMEQSAEFARHRSGETAAAGVFIFSALLLL